MKIKIRHEDMKRTKEGIAARSAGKNLFGVLGVLVVQPSFLS